MRLNPSHTTRRAGPHRAVHFLHSKAILDGREVSVIGDLPERESHSSVVVLWVDPNQGGRILRETTKRNNGIATQLDIQYDDYDGSGGVPESWIHTIFYRNGSPRQIINATVLEYELNPVLPSDTFEVRLPVGTTVSEDGTQSVVSGDGTLIPVSIPTEDSRRFNWKLVVLNGMAAVAVLLWYYRSRGKKEQDQ